MAGARLRWRSFAVTAFCLGSALAAGGRTLVADEPSGEWLPPSPTPRGPSEAGAITDPGADATATDQSSAAALEVQRALGGPLANQFPQLQSPPVPAPATGEQEQAAPETAGPWWKQFRGSLDGAMPTTPPRGPAWGTGSPSSAWPAWWTPAPPPGVEPALAVAPTTGAAPPPPRQVIALRATAAELETTANRLEEIDLYAQADALRELARRLRGDARRDLSRMRASETLGMPVPIDPATPQPAVNPTPRPSDPPRNGQTPPDLLMPIDDPATLGPIDQPRHEPAENDAGTGRSEWPSSSNEFDERSVLVGPAPE